MGIVGTNGNPLREEFIGSDVMDGIKTVMAHSDIGKLNDRGMAIPESVIEARFNRIKTLLLRLRMVCDTVDQFELVVKAAVNEPDPVKALEEMNVRVEEGTFVKPDDHEWVAQKEALLAGRHPKGLNRAQRRGYVKMQKKQAEAAKKKRPRTTESITLE